MTDWYYPLYNGTGNNAFVDILVYMNTITSNVWWSGILLIMFIVGMLALLNKRFEFDKAAMASLGVTNVLAMFLYMMGLIGLPIIILLIIVTGLSGLWLFYNNRR